MKKSKTSQSESENGSAKKNAGEDFLIVGIGASAGGIQALKEFFQNVPADSGMAYVVILHLSPEHKSQLAAVLQTTAKIPVAQVTENFLVEPNRVYVVSPNQSLKMDDGRIVVEPIKTVEERRAPIDIFFRTLADSHQARAVAVILSGTGADGSMGLKRVKERSGAVFVQNQREAEYSDMPRNAIATELVDAVLNVKEIPAKIIAYKESIDSLKIQIEPEAEAWQETLREIFTHLRIRTGHDFTNYKRASVLRRIERRINVRQLESLPAYAKFLRENPEETQALLKNLLISVTNFFRDKEAFGKLETEILPQILQNKKAGDEIRVWVAGCATGEEAYSIAMLLAERAFDAPNAPAIQIFASDIDETVIANAREGFYTLNDAADVSPERLRRFFQKEAEGYRIRRELRDLILFANHNVIKDPPFSRLDLITCRNMFIYLNQTVQERVMKAMHFALNPYGFLFLGSSESIDGASGLYATVSKEYNIFQSREVQRRPVLLPNATPSFRIDLPRDKKSFASLPEQENSTLERISFADLHQRLLEQFAPPSVVVNENYDIVHLSERAGCFLQIAGGEPSNNLLKLVREELRLELRAALYQATEKKTNAEAKNLKIRIDDRDETINIHARPVLRSDDTGRGFILVIFEPTHDVNEPAEIVSTSSEPIVRQLEEQLLRAQTLLRSSTQQYEVQAEELKGSNEELQAMNEELRSAAEELEMSKEELQSVNEELITVNQELKVKIEEVLQSNDDFQNLINSTKIGTIFLDRNFCVKLFTPAACEIFNLLPADYGRPLSDIMSRVEHADLIRDAKTVLQKLHAVEREVQIEDGRAFLVQISPYRTTEDRINGVVITFVNITRHKQLEENLAQSAERFRAIVNQAAAGIGEIDFNGKFTLVNDRFCEIVGYTREEILELQIRDITHADDWRRNAELLEKLAPDGAPFTIEKRYVRKDGSIVWVSNTVSAVFDPEGKSLYALTVSLDITERKQTEQALLESAQKLEQQTRIFDTTLSSITDFTYIFDKDGRFVYSNQALLDLLGITLDEIIGKNFFDLNYPDELAARHQQEIQQVFETRKPIKAESSFTSPTGAGGFYEYIFSPVFDSGGVVESVAGSTRDITERKQMEEALRQSEEHLRLIAESVTDFAIIVNDHERRITSWNKGAENVFGWTEAEAVGQLVDIFFTPEDRANNVPEKEMQTTLKNGRAPDERFHIRKDGTRFYVSGVLTVLKNGAGFVKIARDMSDKIKAEAAQRDKEMLQKLVAAQEDERKRIARDLHDELGQQLTALRLKLEGVRKECENEGLCGKIDEIQVIAKNIDADVDFLAWELRPAALDDLGLAATISNYLREWSKHSGVTAEFHTSGLKRMRFAPEVETNLYRIVQEALNNTHKHAKAKDVEVMLEKRDGSVVLIIEDDGKGFNPKDKATRNKGLGLIGMRERAAIVGGTLEIESAKGEGVTIFARIPTVDGKKEKLKK